MKKRVFLMLGAALALASCSNTESEPVIDNGDVSFTTGDILTRVSGSQFEAADQIAVEAYSASSLYATATYSYDGAGTFTTTEPITQSGSEALSYAAVYPADATTATFGNDFNFTIAADQSSAANYEASDLLVAQAAATTATTPTLTFYHAMSIIDVKITGVDSIADCTVALTAKNTAAVNIIDGSYVATGAATALTPYMTSEGFRVIVAPQDLASGELAVMTINGNTYYWDLTASSTLLSGYKYSYTWSVNEQSGDSDITFEGSINDWIDGEWGTTDEEDEDTESDQGGSSTSDFTISTSTLGISGSVLSGSATIGGIDWTYGGISTDDNYGTIYIELDDAAGYITNTTELSGLKSITIVGNGYVNTNLVVTAGSSANPTTVITSNSADGSGWGSSYEYTIPDGTKYVKFAANQSGTYDASLTTITLEF